MRSMTGYGRGECAQDGFKVAVEIASVNRKQGEVSLTLPRELESLENRIRDTIHERIARGRLTVKVSLHAADGTWARRVRLNVALAKAYAKDLNKLAKELKLGGPLSLDLVARAPGVFQTDEAVEDAEKLWPLVEKAVGQALTGLVRMREREGAHLAKDLRTRMTGVRASVARVKERAPEVLRRYQQQLRERVRDAGLPLPAEDDERLLKEIVYYTDRTNVSEELTRLESHFQQFEDCVKSKEPVGRTLDFLAQEMNREVNTVGSKANDAVISREVVQLKAELEKFREQVQNLE